MEDRRKYQRISVELPARYRLAGAKASVYTSTVINLGAEGICFVAREPVAEGEEIDLKIELQKGETVSIKVKTVWKRPEQDMERSKIGVKIIEAAGPDEEKFIKFYCNKVLIMPAKKKILVVDDEPDMVSLLKIELEHEGYEVVTAFDGKEGYEKYHKEKPDLILLDLMLPQLNGHEVCRKIRRTDNDVATPIIMITAKTDTVDRIRGRVIGAEKYVTKPFQMEALLEEIKAFLK